MSYGRRTTFIAVGVVSVVLVAVAGLWAAFGPKSGMTSQQRSELAQVEQAEAKARPKRAAASVPALCKKLAVSTMGKVPATNLTELSGLVASRNVPGRFWTMEDSGGPPNVVALRGNASVEGTWTLPGATNTDWEDISTGPGPDGQPYLYAADIGDNNAQRDSITIYRAPEPPAPAGGGNTGPVSALTLKYPDGAHDAETLIVDPIRGSLIIVTKDWTGNVYGLTKPIPWGGTATLKKYGPAPLGFATGGDVSADGKIVAVRGYFSLAVWQRKGKEPLTTTMRRKACLSPTGFNDGQGEALALSANGKEAWTIAEGTNPPLLHDKPAG